MKKIIAFGFLILLFSCNSLQKPLEKKSLYEILVGGDYGGGPFQFYELITEPNEFKMLLGDEIIKKYIRKDDIKNANFIIINLGEKEKEGYQIKISKVTETADKIILTIKEIEPKGKKPVVATKPYYIVKVKSKKSIEIN